MNSLLASSVGQALGGMRAAAQRVPPRLLHLASFGLVTLVLLIVILEPAAGETDLATLFLVAASIASLATLGYNLASGSRWRRPEIREAAERFPQAVAGGFPMHRRVRAVFYSILVAFGIHTVLHAWEAHDVAKGSFERERLGELVASQRWVSQRIAYLATAAATDHEESIEIEHELALLLTRATEDATQLRATLLRHGQAHNHHSEPLETAADAWQAESGRLTAAARSFLDASLSSAAMLARIGTIRAQADASFVAAERLVQALERHTNARQQAAAKQARNWSLLTFAVLLMLALFVTEPAARSVRGQYLSLLEHVRERRRLALVAERTTNAVMITDTDHRILWVNDAFQRITGYQARDAIGRTPSEIVIDPRSSEAVAHLRASLTRGEGVRTQLPGHGRDGRELWLEFDIQPLRDEDANLIGCVTVAADITARRRAQADLRVAATAFDSMEAIGIIDSRQTFLKVNPAFTRITGYAPHEVIGRTPREIMNSGRQGRAFYEEMHAALVLSKHWQGELWIRRRNGELFLARLSITAVTDDEGHVENYVAVLSDITEKRKADETIRNLAFYDPLTELPNRRLMRDRLQQVIDSSAGSGRFAAVMFIDLDHFKELNDTRGHDIGDLLLVEVARRLSAAVRNCDTVARQGGDEFVIIVDDLSVDAEGAMRQAAMIAEDLRNELNRPYILCGHEHYSSPSVGVHVFNGHAQAVEELLKCADSAMYEAKRSGRNAIRFFDPETHAAQAERIALDADLRRALPEGQLQIHFQPQVERNGTIVGAEILLRWQHPHRGLVPPGSFICLAEESDLIVDIGAWVLERACEQLAEWALVPQYRHLKLAVNVSARQFCRDDFVARVRDHVNRSGIDASRLELELTESLVVQDFHETVRKMAMIRALGVGLSMDDFGTGHSSLCYLTRLPLDQLKIDRSFVSNMIANRSDALVVETIIGLARSLEIETVAEGVETVEQHAFLDAIGCRLFQGYLHGAPVSAEEFAAMLAKQGRPRAHLPEGEHRQQTLAPAR